MNLAAAYGALVGFFFLGAALLAVGAFISSVTDSQGVAAGLCFAALLVNYFLASLSSFFSSTAFASFAALTFAVAALALIFYLMTKSGFASAVIFIASGGARLCVLHIQERQLRGTVPEYTQACRSSRALSNS